MDGQTTVREIAQKVGVHFTTVALALRDSPKVSAATRSKVKKAAVAMGYRTNPLVSALMARQRMLRKIDIFAELAFISFCKFPGEYRRSHFEAAVVDGAARRAEMLGYRLEEFCLNAPGMTARRLGEILRARGTAGIFFGGSLTSHSHVAKPLHGFASVAMSYCLLRPNVHRVAHHHLLGCETAFRELRKLGKKRVGLVLTKTMDRQVNRLWSSGFLGHRHLLPTEEWVEPLYLEGLESEHRGDFMRWVKQEKPDAILTMHVTLIDWLAKHPAITLATLDQNKEWRGFPGIDQKPHALGRCAMDLLIGQIHRNDYGPAADPQTLLLEGKWVKG